MDLVGKRRNSEAMRPRSLSLKTHWCRKAGGTARAQRAPIKPTLSRTPCGRPRIALPGAAHARSGVSGQAGCAGLWTRRVVGLSRPGHGLASLTASRTRESTSARFEKRSPSIFLGPRKQRAAGPRGPRLPPRDHGLQAEGRGWRSPRPRWPWRRALAACSQRGPVEAQWRPRAPARQGQATKADSMPATGL